MYILWCYVDFLTAEVIVDYKEKRRDTTSGDLFADNLSLARLQLHNQLNVTHNGKHLTGHNEIELGKNVFLCIVLYKFKIDSLFFYFWVR